MKYIRDQVLNGDIVAGTFCNLGSAMTVEIAGLAGFDWVLLDMEHGAGDQETLVHQIHAAAGTSAAPVVRIAWNDPPRFKRVLDLGASGIMVPYVNTEAEARQAAASMRYPPDGVRGVATMNRAGGFGGGFDEYFATANGKLLTVVQIETAQAVQNSSDIARVSGVDVLFIGPTDLSVSLGIPLQFDHPSFTDSLARVVLACRDAGKAPGILLRSPSQLQHAIDDGFSFVAIGSDGGMVASAMRATLDAFSDVR